MSKKNIILLSLFAVAIAVLIAAIVHSLLVRRDLDDSFAKLREQQSQELAEQAMVMRTSIVRDLDQKYKEDIQAYHEAEKDLTQAKARTRALEKAIKIVSE